jgi:hypothetical protein
LGSQPLLRSIRLLSVRVCVLCYLGSSMNPANNEVPQNPCNYAGRNLDPSAWAAMRQSTKNNPFTTAYDFAHGFSIGGCLDAQPMATGSTYEKAAYGNYIFGGYMSAAGFPLSVTLAGANEIAFYHSLSNSSQYRRAGCDLSIGCPFDRNRRS